MEEPPTKKLKAYTGSATYKCKFNPVWQQEFPCVKPARDDPNSFFCSVCERTFTCHHSGKGDITSHIGSQRHKLKAECTQASLRNQRTLSFASSGSLNEKVLEFLARFDQDFYCLFCST